MGDSVAIIGAGIAGLSAGCYARMNGMDACIYELHDKPGGLCTAWQREGYTFDGCIEWLLGTAEGSAFHRVWRELGALQGRSIRLHEQWHRAELANGQALILYRDPQRLAQHLKELGPEDAPRIDALMKVVEHFHSFEPPIEANGFSGAIELLGKLIELAPAVPDLLRYRNTSVQDWAAGFKTPALREGLSAQYEMPDFPLIAMVAMLAWGAKHDAGYPLGGSLPFVHAIESRYRDLGGQVRYESRVKRILVEGNRAVGVELTSGERHHADVVISASDGHATLFDLLEGRYLDHGLRERFATLPRFPSLVRISLGVARDLKGEPHSVSFPLAEPIMLDGAPLTRLHVNHYAYDPSMAPAGKTSVVVSQPASFEAWRTLHTHPLVYQQEKDRLAREVIAALDRRWPGFAADVEVTDVATPVTYQRFTANWNGSMEGWAITTRSLIMRMSDTVPGLSGFHMIGQWVQPGGGLPPSAMSGRNVIRKLCEQSGKAFQTSEP